jgi:hypothetical protein
MHINCLALHTLPNLFAIPKPLCTTYRHIPVWYLKLGHDHNLLHTFQLLICCYPVIQQNNLR